MTRQSLLNIVAFDSITSVLTAWAVFGIQVLGPDDEQVIHRYDQAVLL